MTRIVVLVIVAVAVVFMMGDLLFHADESLPELAHEHRVPPRASALRPSSVSYDLAHLRRTNDESSSRAKVEEGMRGVCRSESGDPIEGALVSWSVDPYSVVQSGDGLSVGDWARTGSDGHFVLRAESVEVGTKVEVVARHPEFSSASLAIIVGESASPIELVLEAGLSIRGRVLGVNREPLKLVHVWARGAYSDHRALSSDVVLGSALDVHFATSNDAGWFELKGLANQQYMIDVVEGGLRVVVPKLPYARTVATPGEDLEIVLEPAAIIAVRALDRESGQGIPGAGVQVNRESCAAASFYPGISYSGTAGIRPPSIGALGDDLSYFGADPKSIPPSPAAEGLVIVHGMSDVYPVRAGLRVEVTVVADGYVARTIEVPLHAWGLPQLPEPEPVEMDKALDGPDVGTIHLQVLGFPEDREHEGQSLVRLLRKIERADERRITIAGGRAAADSITEEGRRANEYLRAELDSRRRAHERGMDLWQVWAKIDATGLAVIEGVPAGDYEFHELCGLTGDPFSVSKGQVSRVVASLEGAELGGMATRQLNTLLLEFFDQSGRELTGIGVSLHSTGDRASSSHPLSGASVEFDEEVLAPGTAHGHGPIELRIPPGTYEVRAYRPGLVSVSRSIELNRSPMEVRVEMQRSQVPKSD